MRTSSFRSPARVQSGGDTVSAVTFKIIFGPVHGAARRLAHDVRGAFLAAEIRTYLRREGSEADFNEAGKITDAKWLYIESRMINYVRDQEELKAGGEPYDERAFDENGEPLQF